MPTSALVIGGSLAGMCAARMLSDVVDRVTIVERDAYPSSHEFRAGVPQARHVHNLQDCLDTYGIDDPRLPDRFFSAQAQFQRTPWLFAAADDLRLPATEGKRSASVRLFNWYRPKLVACPDRQVGACLAEVTHLVKPMSALFAPRVVSRVLASAMRRRIKTMGKASSDGLRSMPPGGE